MNVKKVFLLSALTLLFSGCQVNAYTEKGITEYSNGIVKVVEASQSEENIMLENYTKDIQIDEKMYEVASVEREKSESNSRTETKQSTAVLNTNKEDKIKSYFGETFHYEDEKYKGELPITNIDIKTISQGSYEEIDEKKIDFEGYSQNDLNEIAKEKQINNITYYLINVDWQPENSETIDNQSVPVTYKGTMLYQTVLTKKNPNKYEVTVTYSGNVEKIDTIYDYSILYQPIKEKEEPVIVEEKHQDIVPIIISGLGIGLLSLIILLGSNIKIYNKTDNGHKLIGKFRINEKNKVIDITKYQYKTSSNMYSIKMTQSLYRKMKDKTIYIQIGKIKKPIYVNTPYIETII